MPEQPQRVVDSHVHFWDPKLLRYPWLKDVPALNRPFLPAEYPPFELRAFDVAIVVEANVMPEQAEEEVGFLVEVASREPRVRGIVGFANLLDERSRAGVLNRLRGTPSVVGVRHNIQGQPAGFALQPAFVRGVQEVGDHGLVFDLCVTAGQLNEVAELVRRCPRTTFVLDHCGKPAIREGDMESWSADLAVLAQQEHVACKLSGLLTEASPEQCTHEGLQPYASHALSCFGAARMLYGSDWPVCTLQGGVSTWRRLTERFTEALSPSERNAVYEGNATRIYGLRINGSN